MIVGFCVSFTVTVNEQLADPQLLFAVMFTVVVPILNSVPLPLPLPVPVVAPVNVYVNVGAGIPVDVGLYVTTAPHWLASLGTVMLAGHVIVGTALTVTVAVIGVPPQLFGEVGVMVNVTVCDTVVLFISVPLILLPKPLAAMPVTFTVLSLVQLYVVPVTVLVRLIVVIGPEQTVCEDGVAVATGLGFTITVAVIAVPGQPFAVGVIVNVTVNGAAVLFTSEPLILPLPLAAMPVTPTVLSLVQLNVVPLTGPVIAIVVIGPEQTVCEVGVAVAVGVGFTVIVEVCGVPVQPAIE